MKRFLALALLAALLLCGHALAGDGDELIDIPGETGAMRSLNLTFTGDVTLGSEELKRRQASSFVTAAAEKGYEYFFANYAAMFAADDATIINFEGTLTDSARQENKGKTYRFRGDTDFVKILQLASVEGANVSNNHSMDFGSQGYNSTVKTLGEAGIGFFGGQTTWILEKNGLKVAFIGLNSTKVNGNRKWFTQEIPRLKSEEGVNAVVMVFHAGSEYSRRHTKAQTSYAQWAIDAGADLVIMHHPHVVQGLDIYKDRYICYSLGNFCFGGNKEVRAIETVVAGVRLDFEADGTYAGTQLTLYPAHISGTEPENNYQPVPVTGEEAQAVMRLIQNDTEFELAPYTDEAGSAAQAYLPAAGGNAMR